MMVILMNASLIMGMFQNDPPLSHCKLKGICNIINNSKIDFFTIVFIDFVVLYLLHATHTKSSYV